MPYYHFLELFAILTSSFITPFVTAAVQPPATPLARDLDYFAYAAGNVSLGNFSTDPTQPFTGRVAAAAVYLQTYIISPRLCIRQGDTPTYRILLRNVGSSTLTNLKVRFIYWSIPPAPPIAGAKFVIAQPDESGRNDLENWVEWTIPSLAPGGSTDVVATIEVIGPTTRLPTKVIVNSSAGETTTSHTIDGPCGPYTGPYTPLPPKLPAIVCDPNEAGCSNTYNSITLGPRYGTANNTGDLQLGARFAEAVSDIIPGECRVLDDDVVTDPPFHDGLTRYTEPAAQFLASLRESDRDFERVVHENELLGIANKLDGKQALRDIHRKYIERMRAATTDALNGTISTNAVRTQINQWVLGWKNETIAAQVGLAQAYTQLQQERREKFDPMAEHAKERAKQSINAACLIAGSDGGLSPLLPPAKSAYTSALSARQTAYNTTQSNFLNGTEAGLYLLPAWHPALLAALTAFDGGNRQPLSEWLSRWPLAELGSDAVFNQAWDNTYGKHAREDITADNQVRLGPWNVAIDAPKRVVTNCAKELVFAAPVETTWCESGRANELLLKGAPFPFKELDPSATPPVPPKFDVRPPQPISNGPLTTILNQAATNPECGPGVGMPYWAEDCSCHCGELVPTGPDTVASCQSIKDITRHDRNVTTRRECLEYELSPHQDRYF